MPHVPWTPKPVPGGHVVREAAPLASAGIKVTEAPQRATRDVLDLDMPSMPSPQEKVEVPNMGPRRRDFGPREARAKLMGTVSMAKHTVDPGDVARALFPDAVSFPGLSE